MSDKIKENLITVVMIGITIVIYSIVVIDFVISAEKIEPTTTETTAITSETIIETTTEETTIQEQTTEPISTRREVTDEEYNLLLRVCMSEAGGKYGDPLEGKVAVVETVLNRVDIGWGTISEVINAPYQYSTADNGDPDETVVEAVEIALSGDMYPNNMVWFRTGYYHDYGTPYKQIGSHYFSLLEVE